MKYTTSLVVVGGLAGLILLVSAHSVTQAVPFRKPVIVQGTNSSDMLFGTPGNDMIIGKEGSDNIYALAGNDKILAGEGNDTITGGQGADFMNCGDGAGDTVIDFNATEGDIVHSCENLFS